MSGVTPMEISAIPWTVVFSAALLLVQGLLAWMLWSLRKQYVGRDECAAQCKKLGDKQVALEAAHKCMPSDDDIGGIEKRLGGIEGEIKALLATVQGQAETMKRIEHPLNLLLEHHLSRRS